MEEKLSRLFDYQKFESNDKLSQVIQKVESKYPNATLQLSDDELSLVAAAAKLPMRKEQKKRP